MGISNRLIKRLIKESIRKNLREDAPLRLLDPNNPLYSDVADTTFTIPLGLLTAEEAFIPTNPAKNPEGLKIPKRAVSPHVDPRGNYYLQIIIKKTLSIYPNYN